MWKLTEIYAQNICAFRELHYILQQGVTTLIFGDNRDNESQRSNGSGKSALIECVAIGITGAPLRKIKNEEIINDNSDESLIELIFGNNSTKESLRIERKLFRKGAAEISCYISEGKDENEKVIAQHSVDAYNKYILETLGITKDEIYNNFILSKHKYQDFLSCPDKEKKDIINRFSNGNLVDQALAEIIKDKEPIAKLLQKAELEFAGVEGRINMLNEQIEEEKNSREEKAKTREEKIVALEDKITEKRSLIREKAEELSRLEIELIQVEKTDELIQELESSDCKLEDYLSGLNNYLPLISPSRRTDWDSVIKDKKAKIIHAESELKTWDAAFEDAEKNVSVITAKYDNLNLEFQEFIKTSKDKAETYDGELMRLENEYLKINCDVDTLKKKRTALSTAIESLNNKLAGTIACPSCGFEFIVSDKYFDVEQGKLEVKEKDKEYITLASKINGNKDKLDSVEEELVQIREQKRQLATERASKTDKLIQAEQEVTKASNEMRRIKNNQEQIAGRINMLNQDIDGIIWKIFDEAFELVDEAYRSNERKQQHVREDINAIENSIDTLNKTIIELKDNTGSGILESLKKSLGDNQIKSSDLLAKKVKIELELQTLERQERNFIEFKTYLSNTKINALSQITNEFLESIGSDLRIKLSGYTVLKSGKVREKISVSLIRAGLDCGSFGKFSSGEASRVNLATILAMQKLINGNCDIGKGLDLLILDEILSEVDEEGLSCMLDALNSLNITAWVVTHGLTQENYPYRLKVIKENGESNIQ